MEGKAMTGSPEIIRELVERFERNIEHYKDSSYKEEQLKQVSTPVRCEFFCNFTQFIEKLPIRTINFSDPADKARHDRMVSLVEQMLDLQKKLAKATIPHEKQMIQRQINATDNQIDTLVYELYGLTEEEMKIVEESVK